MNKLYNISPDCKSMLYTADQIAEAARQGQKLLLSLGKHHSPAPCRLAATVSGWCTVVLTDDNYNIGDRRIIVQDWAGAFTCA